METGAAEISEILPELSSKLGELEISAAPGSSIIFFDIIYTPRLVDHGSCSAGAARESHASAAKNRFDPRPFVPTIGFD